MLTYRGVDRNLRRGGSGLLAADLLTDILTIQKWDGQFIPTLETDGEIL